MTGWSATPLLLIHVALALGAIAVIIGVRVWVCRGGNPDAAGEAFELAYVKDGPRLVLFTCLAVLRQQGLVDSAPQWRGGGIVPVEGRTVPVDAPALDRAVLAALPEYRRVPDLLDDEKVADVVGRLGVRLVQRGWLISAKTQSRMRWYALPGWLVAAWCLLQFGLTVPHFGEPGRAVPALGLLGVGFFLAFGTYLVTDVPISTRAGRAALRRARTELREEKNAGWRAYPIAVGGEEEFWRDGQEFALQAGGSPSGEMGPMPHLMTHGIHSRRGALRRW